MAITTLQLGLLTQFLNNNNYSFVILLLQLFTTMLTNFLQATSLMCYIFRPRLFYSHAISHKAEWITTTNSLPALCCHFIVHYNPYSERSWSKMFVFSPSRKFYCDLFLCMYNAHSCCVRLRCVFIIYLFYTFAYVALLLSISFIRSITLRFRYLSLLYIRLRCVFIIYLFHTFDYVELSFSISFILIHTYVLL